jgi:cytochrome c551
LDDIPSTLDDTISGHTKVRAGILLAGLLLCMMVIFASCGGLSLAKLPPGNAQRGARVFTEYCAKCHSIGPEQKIGPSLQHVGSQLTQQKMQLIIEQGLGTMDGGIVHGQDEADVIAFLETLK